MNENTEVKQASEVSQKGHRKNGRSLFAPIVLIAAGAFFLLSNLGLIAQPNWVYAFGFWPLLLIFIGVNILVVQLPAPAGTFLSLLVSLATVAVFGYLLLSGPDNAALRSLGIPTTVRELEEYPFTVPVDGVTSAEIELQLGNFPATVTDSGDEQTLAEGSIWTSGELLLDVQREGQSAAVKIGEESGYETFLNPLSWFPEPGDHTWRFNLNRQLPLDLQINSGNGASNLDLADLNLSHFRLNSSNGGVTVSLPGGDYEAQIEGGNGAVRGTLPSDGRQAMEIDSGNGSMQLLLPAGVPARVEFETGNGALSVDGRFDLIDGDTGDGIYETADYSSSGDGILLQVETGNGSIQISQP